MSRERFFFTVSITWAQLMIFSSLVSGEKETMSYFAAHFEEQLKLYNTQVGLLCQSVCLCL